MELSEQHHENEMNWISEKEEEENKDKEDEEEKGTEIYSD